MSVTRSHMTRLLHLLLLLAVLHQLFGSQFMEKPMPGEDPDWPYYLHQWVGVAGLMIVMWFWIWTFLRHPSETPLAKLFPWLAGASLRAVGRDIAGSLRDLKAMRIPGEGEGALASAVHGLGLAVVTIMALTGAAWFLFLAGTTMGRPVIRLHKLFANLMWAYLIGHVCLAFLRQATGDGVFSRMFWVRGRKTPKALGSN